MYEVLKNIEDEIIEIRRYLHENPELSFQEEKTPEFIAGYHRKLGHEVQTGVGGRGVVAKLVGGKPGKTVALRADFDALPVQEENDIPYKSTVPGVMHACGHDGHTAIVLGVAKSLNKMRSELPGTVVFIHQHAEEIVPGGALQMIKDGCLNGIHYVYGMHIWTMFPLGQVYIAEGNMMAATDKFEIKILGKGGHGGVPHESVDLIVLASHLIVHLQSIVSRRLDPFKPAVVSVGSIHAGRSFNVLPDKVEISGTVRTFSDDVRKNIETEIGRILEGLCATCGVRYEFEYQYGYPAVVNHPEEARRVMSVAKETPGVKGVVTMQPMMIGEDFAYYLKEKPGAFFLIGARDPGSETVYPHHHPKFSFDERVLLIASAVMANVALNSLTNG
jgi:amidohydrolase